MRVIDVRDGSPLVLPRPRIESVDVVPIVKGVRESGDEAVREYTQRFDGVRIDSLAVDANQLDEAAGSISKELLAAIEEAARRIRAFAEQQRIRPWQREIAGGKVGEMVVPVDRAGVYVPGGRAAYPSTVLMCGIPAAVAGVGEVAMCVPPGSDGRVSPVTLAAAKVAGITEVYRVGGAQAIAAMAYGTQSLRSVNFLCGPGNAYVAQAKRLVAGDVAIDSIAGPSEIAIVADDTANPNLIARDLVAQAEHGPGGIFVVVTPSQRLVSEVELALQRALQEAGDENLASTVEAGAFVVVVSGRDEGLAVANEIAPEHLCLMLEGPDQALKSITNAGAVFLGENSPVSLGDYLAGSNHVLPTGGAARSYSGLRTSHFQRTMGFVNFSPQALRDAMPHVESFAAAEGLPQHAAAIRARFGGNK